MFWRPQKARLYTIAAPCGIARAGMCIILSSLSIAQLYEITATLSMSVISLMPSCQSAISRLH